MRHPLPVDKTSSGSAMYKGSVNREFTQGELVLLWSPEKDGFTPVIFIEELAFDTRYAKVLLTESGETLTVNIRRITKVESEE